MTSERAEFSADDIRDVFCDFQQHLSAEKT
jgi:hypothetical protein